MILTDISERKRVETMSAELLRMEQRARLGAEASNRAKDEFLAVLSHELRTPLTAMLGWIRMLAGNRLDREATAHAIEVIERNTRLQAQIVEDLLDVSRIISGKMVLEIRDVVPATVLRTAVEGVQAAAALKDVAIDLDVDATGGSVRGDGGRLQQVFSNLLSNAVKFTAPGGRVTVTAGPDGEGLRVAVTDTGRGIDATLLPHVFEPFRQAEGTSRRTHTGLGLGLAIVRHLVELHGGRVEAFSPGLGRGATFTVWLPAEPPERTTRRRRGLCRAGGAVRGHGFAAGRSLAGRRGRRRHPGGGGCDPARVGRRGGRCGERRGRARRLPVGATRRADQRHRHGRPRRLRPDPGGAPAARRRWCRPSRCRRSRASRIAWTRSAPATIVTSPSRSSPAPSARPLPSCSTPVPADWAAAWYGSWRSPDLPGGRRRTAASLRSREDDSDLAGVTHQPQHRRTGRRSQSGAIHGGAVRSSQVRT